MLCIASNVLFMYWFSKDAIKDFVNVSDLAAKVILLG